MPAGEFIKQWRSKHDDETRAKNKSKQRELLEKWWGEYLTPSRDPKDPENKLNYLHGFTTPREHQHTKENSKSPNTSPTYLKLLQYLDP